MKTLKLIYSATAFCGLLMALLLSCSEVYSQNNALHFDGENDFIVLYPINGMDIQPENFTVEMWFKLDSPGNECEGEFFRGLFSFYGGENSRFIVGECNGELRIYFACQIMTSPIPPYPIYPEYYSKIITVDIWNETIPIDDGWYHIAVVREAQKLIVYLKGSCVIQDDKFFATICEFNPYWFEIGRSNPFPGFSPEPFPENLFWNGQIDEVRLWNISLPIEQITEINCKPCPINPADYNSTLIAYYSFNDADIIPNDDNRDKKDVSDFSLFIPSNQGVIDGFNLQGDESNFIKSTSPVHYPAYFDYNVTLRDPPLSKELSEICSGDPVHFSITKPWNEPQASTSNTTFRWAYSDNGGSSWTDIDTAGPMFNGFSFVSKPNHQATTANCPEHPLGYVDRMFKATITVGDEPFACEYITNTTSLRICCPVKDLRIDFNPETQDVLCEGGNVFNISASCNLIPPGHNNSNYISIKWEVSKNGDAYTTIPGTMNLASISYLTFLTPGTVCFRVTVSNCACDPKTIIKCFTVDPKPVCGTITGASDNLITIPGQPYNYLICPGDDAAVKIDIPFEKCRPQWQYRFPNKDPENWVNLGFTNGSQNTNILPHLKPADSPYLWPLGETCIEYRIACLPLSYPNSGCPPCFSNIVSICLAPAPVKPEIVALGDVPICEGDSVQLAVDNADGSSTYRWYLNGEFLKIGLFHWASRQGNYVVTATDINECYNIASDPFSLEVCTVIAKICCPIPDCPCPGDTITIPGVNSYSSCGGELTYVWSWSNGTLIADNGSSIQHVPDPDDPNGTTYTLTVKDENDCEGTAQRTVIPCQERPFVCGEPFIDKRKGREYQTVKIGNQCWMAENLNIGTLIQGTVNQSDNATIEKYCYNNDPANCDAYGGLYQWDEMMQYLTNFDVQGICPDHWRLSNYWDWETLLNYLKAESDYQCIGNPEFIAKSLASTNFWNTSSVICAVGNPANINNETGFTGLPGGYRNTNGGFYSLNDLSPWWSSNMIEGTQDIYYVSLAYLKADVNFWYINKKLGFSVRCIRD